MNKRVSVFLVIFAVVLVINVLGPAIRWGMEVLIESLLLAAVLPLLWGRQKTGKLTGEERSEAGIDAPHRSVKRSF